MEEFAPPPPKRFKVAIAGEEGRGTEDGTTSSLLMLAAVAWEVADGTMVRLPSPISNGRSRRGTLRILHKNTMAPMAVPSSLGAAATGPAAAALAPAISGETVAAVEIQKRKAVAATNMPYKRLKQTTARAREPPSPAGWVEKVVRMGGWNPWFVVKKRLFDTDLKAHYSRLPLPVSKESDPQRGGAERLVFTFSDSELHEFWNGDGLPVTVLDRWGRECNGGLLRRWGSKGWIVLKGSGVWPGAARSMGLKAHDTVEVLCFRVRPPKQTAGKLVLVLLPA